MNAELENDKVILTLTKDEALILCEFTYRFTDQEVLSIVDQAEERILWNICGYLEKILPEIFDPDWQKLVLQARSNVRDKTE